MLNLTVATLALIPGVILFMQYLKIRITDYALFSLTFIFASLSMYVSVIANIYDDLKFYQLHYLFWNFTFLCLFFFSMHIIWETYPKILATIGLVWSIILDVTILFWKKFEQPVNATVLFWKMNHTQSSYFPQGAGLSLESGTIIYSTGHAILMYLFTIFVAIIFLYCLNRAEITHHDDKTKQAMKLWYIGFTLILLYYVLGLPWFPRFNSASIILIVGLTCLAYIAIKIPQGMFISNVQVVRAVTIYLKIKDNPKTKSFGGNDLTDYLEYLSEHFPDLKDD